MFIGLRYCQIGVGSYCFIRTKRQCEKPKKQDKTNSVPTPFLFTAYRREQVGIIHYIMKKNILIVAMVLGCLSCGSKTEKSVEKQKDLVKEYL